MATSSDHEATPNGQEDGGSPVSESTKSAMAAALARKKGAPSAGAHLDGSAKVGGATENHKTTRTFRRKSV